MSIFLDQADFMELGGQTVDRLHLEQVFLYENLIKEESNEFTESIESSLGVSVANESVKEAVDVIVVAAGYLISVLGADGAQKAWDAVHESNLAKVAGAVEKRDDGKILKNEDYKKVAKAKLMAVLEALVDKRRTVQAKTPLTGRHSPQIQITG